MDCLVLDGQALTLAEIEDVACKGRAVEIGADALKRMAASQKLELDVRAVDGSTVSFVATRDTRTTLTDYLLARGITGD